jgi:hypothetical protein
LNVIQDIGKQVSIGDETDSDTASSQLLLPCDESRGSILLEMSSPITHHASSLEDQYNRDCLIDMCMDSIASDERTTEVRADAMINDNVIHYTPAGKHRAEFIENDYSNGISKEANKEFVRNVFGEGIFTKFRFLFERSNNTNLM